MLLAQPESKWKSPQGGTPTMFKDHIRDNP